MIAKSTYCILPEKKLILEYHSGNVSLKDFFDLKLQESKHPLYKPEFSVITDIRNVNIANFDVEFVKLFAEFLKAYPIFKAERITVVLTDKQFQVVLGNLFEIHMNDQKVRIHTVSSLKVALSKVQLLNDFNYISQRLEKLETV